MIDSQKIAQIRAAVDAALKQVGEKLGVGFELGNGKYNPKTASFKLNVIDANANGEVESKIRADFRAWCWRYSLKETDLDREFTYMGDKVKIIGLNPKARKNPLIVLVNDKPNEMVMQVSTALACLGRLK